VWVKLMGDEDIKEAYKYARLKSSQMRKKIKDPESVEYQLQVSSLDEQDDKDLYDLIVASKVNDFTRESVAVIVRDELPKLEEVAVEPDAPKLEEQEKLDEAEDSVEQRFTDAINKYVKERQEVLEAELKKYSRKKLVEAAAIELQELAPMQEFRIALDDQKGYRGTFNDKSCKVRTYTDLEEYLNIHSAIKGQLVTAYDELEIDPSELKK